MVLLDFEDEDDLSFLFQNLEQLLEPKPSSSIFPPTQHTSPSSSSFSCSLIVPKLKRHNRMSN